MTIELKSPSFNLYLFRWLRWCYNSNTLQWFIKERARPLLYHAYPSYFEHASSFPSVLWIVVGLPFLVRGVDTPPPDESPSSPPRERPRVQDGSPRADASEPPDNARPYARHGPLTDPVVKDRHRCTVQLLATHLVNYSPAPGQEPAPDNVRIRILDKVLRNRQNDAVMHDLIEHDWLIYDVRQPPRDHIRSLR